MKMSAAAYFGCVAGVTALGFGLALLFRPAFAYSVREWMGLEKPPKATPDSFYAVRVAPLFDEHCSGCHGSGRQKGQLRLDSYAGVVRGGKSGLVIPRRGDPSSELIRRITLPPSDDRAMPPVDKEPLTPDEVTVIKLWVAAGASGVQPVGAIKGAPEPEVEITFPEIDAAAVEKQRAPLAADVARLQKRFPGLLAYESRGSADLHLNASFKGASFGDAVLKEFAAVGGQIVWADLSSTATSDASIRVLASMRRLRMLRLSNTQMTDAALEGLMSLRELQAISVMGTAVTEPSVAALRAKGVRVYDGKAQVQTP